MAYETHSDVQSLLADVRAWVPVVVEVDGKEYPVTGLRIEHENPENAKAREGTEAAIMGVGAQTKAVLETTTDSPTVPTHLAK